MMRTLGVVGAVVVAAAAGWLLRGWTTGAPAANADGLQGAAQQSDLLATVTWVVSVTSALLIVMGAVGIATLMVLVVRQRRVEIGLRRALGATPSDVALQFFLEGIALAAAGVLVGLLIGLAASAVLSGLRVLAAPLDPLLVLGSAAFSLGSAAAACAIPVLLAARPEPSVALRS
jgi:ABC-type antimicrobial peptide transport system permease subunit